jgi:transposase-like protein
MVALSQRLAAFASPQRMRIIAELMTGQTHVSELARRVGMSRALLYMHLTKLRVQSCAEHWTRTPRRAGPSWRSSTYSTSA